MYLKKIPNFFLIATLFIKLARAQYDFGEKRSGEHRGRLTPGEIATITIIGVATGIALGVSIFFCYYIHKQNKKMQTRYTQQNQKMFN